VKLQVFRAEFGSKVVSFLFSSGFSIQKTPPAVTPLLPPLLLAACCLLLLLLLLLLIAADCTSLQLFSIAFWIKWQLTHDASCITRHTPHVTHHTSHITRHTLHVTHLKWRWAAGCCGL